jgi:ribosome-associated protein
MQRPITARLLGNELQFSTARSGGPGGQNVNKVNSKVILKFDIRNSSLLTPDEKDILLNKLASRLTSDGVLMLTAQESRSQFQNKDAIIEKFDKLMVKAFEKKKARRNTKPSKSAVAKRINKKKQHSEKKKWRQKPHD